MNANVTLDRHPWDVSPRQAIDIQNAWRERVECRDRLLPVQRVAGVDVGFEAGGQITRAAVVVLDFPSLAVVDRAVSHQPTTFPYVPGLLSFRELPAVLSAVAQLQALPDLFLCDGQGIAHPRRFGIASHLGVWLDVPSIGVGKTRLIGSHAEPPVEKGGWSPLEVNGECVGAVLRTRKGVKPVFVSIGHRICLETALHWVMACTTRYRLPETTRQAHHLASAKQ